MSAMPYTDEDGRTLQAGICEAPDHVLLKVTDGEAVAEVCVKNEDMPGVTAALYEAARFPAPVILERPEISDAGIDAFGAAEISRDGGQVVIGCGPPLRLAPQAARKLAALIAAYADAAEGEPDPAEVGELAEAIRAEIHPGYTVHGLRPSESDRAAARAALRWLKRREAGRG